MDFLDYMILDSQCSLGGKMIKILKAKILDNSGEILKKFLNKNYIQKYLTPEEIAFIELLPPKDWVEKLEFIKNYKYTETKNKALIAEYNPAYVFDNIKFDNIQDLARYIYCKENNINAVDWVRKNLGPKYLRQFRKKNDKDFKRNMLEIKCQDDIPVKVYENRNVNIKIKLHCSKCGCVDYQSPKTVLHFNNLLCKRCRRAEKKNG